MKSIKKSERPSSSSTIRVAKLDGKKTKTLKKFYKKIVARLDFPEYFGYNLDALADALCDLTWLSEKEVHLYIKNPTGFLCRETAELKNEVLEILAEAASNQIEEDRSFRVRGVIA